jgi:microcystin-dependent protein
VNFGLPDLRGRVPIHMGAGHTLGERLGEAAHTLTQAEMPAHTHPVMATSDSAAVNTPLNNLLATTNNAYTAPSNLVAMNAAAVTNAGGSQAHENRQPFLTISFCIALQGIFPSQT